MLHAVRPHSLPARNFAGIRKSAASDAINAISLARITNSLRARHIPIRCHTINDGTPRRFVWRKGSRRFEGGHHLSEQGTVERPCQKTLGPSTSGSVCSGRVLFGWCAQEHHAKQPVELRHAFLGGKPRNLSDGRRRVRRFQTPRATTVLSGPAEGVISIACRAGRSSRREQRPLLPCPEGRAIPHDSGAILTPRLSCDP